MNEECLKTRAVYLSCADGVSCRMTILFENIDLLVDLPTIVRDLSGSVILPFKLAHRILFSSNAMPKMSRQVIQFENMSTFPGSVFNLDLIISTYLSILVECYELLNPRIYILKSSLLLIRCI